MKRREFIGTIAASAVAFPFVVRAQQTLHHVPVVGVLWHAANAEEEGIYLDVLRKAFSDLGYVEGKTIVLEHRFPAEQPERFRALAQDLVEAKPDVIISVAVLGAVELRKLTRTIPIVFVLVSDPVGFGLVERLSHPGGNATGLSLMTNDLSGKRLQLLKQAIPNLSRVALLVDRTDAYKERTIKSHQTAAEALGISLWSVEISTPNDLEPAFAKMAEDRADGFVRGPGGQLFVERARLGAAALAHHLPGMSNVAEEVSYGLLMSYGPDFPEYFRRAAYYADQILKGAKPADLPVEQPTKFKLVVNLKTANALGRTMPPSLLLSADEVIE